MISETDAEKILSDESAAAAAAWSTIPPPAEHVLYHYFA